MAEEKKVLGMTRDRAVQVLKRMLIDLNILTCKVGGEVGRRNYAEVERLADEVVEAARKVACMAVAVEKFDNPPAFVDLVDPKVVTK